MALAFSGPALPLVPADVIATAEALGCDEAAVRAVMQVETGGEGGFLQDGSGRPRILFEATVFSRLTDSEWDRSHPTISCPSVNYQLYRGGPAEYDRLEQAVALDREAALAAASWGLFQVMGHNAVLVGYADVEAFVTAMAQSAGEQLLAFAGYCTANGLCEALRTHDWRTFARRYNGRGYLANHYDVRLAVAYGRLTQAPWVVGYYLTIGATGGAVARLQAALNQVAGAALVVDGQFGSATQAALIRFQDDNGLAADGIAGPRVMLALGLAAP